jgi:hypothetical protein
MPKRYLLIKRTGRPNYYCEDTVLDKQTTLGTPNKSDAERIIHAKNEAEYQPAISLQIARAYQAANDSQLSTRTWQFVMDEGAKIKEGPTQDRWKRAMQQKAFAPLRNIPILDTRPEHFLAVLKKGTVCTNMFLRRSAFIFLSIIHTHNASILDGEIRRFWIIRVERGDASVVDDKVRKQCFVHKLCFG